MVNFMAVKVTYFSESYFIIAYILGFFFQDLCYEYYSLSSLNI